MSGSLKDQLIKAGLVSRENANKPRDKGPARGRAAVPPPPRRNALPAREAAKPRPDNPPANKPQTASNKISPEEHAARKALFGKLRELVDKHKLNDPAAEVAYNFLHGERIKRIYVTEVQRKALAAGELALVHIRNRSFLVPPAIGEEIAALDPAALVDTKAEPADASNSDDPYKDFPVPDDLIW
jgi:hypothetical protein